jgi:hypothetical protein
MLFKEVFKNSLVQLLAFYSILLVLVAFGFFSKYALHFEVFAVILAVIGAWVFWKSKGTEFLREESKFWTVLIIASFAILLASRIIPLLLNPVPLGYDFGIYKFAFEQHAKAFPNIYSTQLPHWIGLWSPLGIYLISDLISLTGLQASQFLSPLMVFFELLLGIAVYYCAKQYFGKKAAVLSLFFYSISIIQFKTFELFYLKNVLGLALLLAAFYFLKKQKSLFLVLSAGFLAGIHRPTFLLFAIAFAVYFFTSLKDWKKNLTNGLGILAFVLFFYWNSFQDSILGYLIPSIENPAGGAFINFFTFQYSILFYLPFALLALFLVLLSKKHKELSIVALFLFAVAVFQLLFYNRYLIQLDVFLVLFAGFGFSKALDGDFRKPLKFLLVGLVLIASIISIFTIVQETQPLISRQELEFIKKIPEITEPNASILTTSSYYSPWILGFSERKTIMPGLFESDEWNLSEWRAFWDANSTEEAVKMLSVYEKPLYVFNGEFASNNMEKFRQPCFRTIADDGKSSLLKMEC